MRKKKEKKNVNEWSLLSVPSSKILILFIVVNVSCDKSSASIGSTTLV